tara:strand:- start:21 stop:188 length:168 start_codon:yes stop_codon:yes gene_type:complete
VPRSPLPTKLPEPELITENKPKQYDIVNKYMKYERLYATNEQGEEIIIDMPKDLI